MGSYGPPPKRFVKFRKLKRPYGRKTDRWTIKSHDGTPLGIIRFFPQWRCYVSESDKDIVWSWECHEEVKKFLKKQTDAWKETVRLTQTMKTVMRANKRREK